MEHVKVSIVRNDSKQCSKGNCSTLPQHIRAIFPQADISYRTKENLATIPNEPPDILFVPFHGLQEIQEQFETYQSLRPTTAILGIICLRHDSLGTIDNHLLQYVDDFICCPFHEVNVSLRLHKILQSKLHSIDDSPNPVTRSPYARKGLIGQSPSFLHTTAKISLLAKCDGTVLISGETGTGKELFARAIHYDGPRSAKPFVPVNCGAIPDHLFENEVFGHTKGAFTDANTEQKGLLQEAEGGTLFLDEVDSLSASAQIKLLRFLQDQEYRPLGSPKSLKANVRILAATNQNLRRLLQDGQLREDLFYRLNILSINIPPLRDRMEDIPLLVNHFLKRAQRSHIQEGVEVAPDALEKLLAYSWPGNVRELEAIMQGAFTFKSSAIIEAKDIDLPTLGKPQSTTGNALRQAKARAVETFERTFLMNLLTTYRGNVSRAALAAGTDRRSFQRLLQKHCLDRHAFLS